MAIFVTKKATFIPAVEIKITPTFHRDDVIEAVTILKKYKNNQGVLITDTFNFSVSGKLFTWQDANLDFDKQYTYSVSAEMWRSVMKIGSTTSSIPNFWDKNFWAPSGLSIASNGRLTGTGMIVSKPDYAKTLQSTLGRQFWTVGIGSGGDKVGNSANHYKADYRNVAFAFQHPTQDYDRLFYFRKYQNSSGRERYWNTWSKRTGDPNYGNEVQTLLRLHHDEADGQHVELSYGNGVTIYGMSGGAIVTFGTPISGAPRRFAIHLKNNAWVQPIYYDAGGTVTSYYTYYVYEWQATESNTVDIVTDEEPHTEEEVIIPGGGSGSGGGGGSGSDDAIVIVRYGIIIDADGNGFRTFHYGKNRVILTGEWEAAATTKLLSIQGNKYPLAFQNDNQKSHKIDFTIVVNSRVLNLRMQKMAEKNYIYIFCPREWGSNLETGVYTFEGYSHKKIKRENAYEFSFKGCQQVDGLAINFDPKDTTYGWIKDNIRNYYKLYDQEYADWRDLAISPISGMSPGEVAKSQQTGNY